MSDRAKVTRHALDVFDDDCFRNWTSASRPTDSLRGRIEVVSWLRGGPSSGDGWPLVRSRALHWCRYLYVARGVGLLDQTDVVFRLRSRDDDCFRGAMAECIAAWFLARRLRMSVIVGGKAREGRNVEFNVEGPAGTLAVEVKSPYHVPKASVFMLRGEEQIKGAIEEANRQFVAGSRNLLVLVPEYMESLCSERDTLVHALFGEFGATFDWDPATGSAVGDLRSTFLPTGHLLNRSNQRGRPWKPDGTPRFTRVGAVLCIQELNRGQVGRVTHAARLLHNPMATTPITEDGWRNVPQLVRRGSDMHWTDGVPIVA